MEFIDNLFVDKKIKDIETILYSLKKGIPVYNIYVLYVEEESTQTAVILSSTEFLKKKMSGGKVIGLASGKKGGNQLFSSIVEYWLAQGNTFSDFKKGIMSE